jgi:heme-degrading monooxygenase HmoA
MYARIIWGKILPGKWNEYEKAYKAAIAKRGPVKGLVVQWLAQDESDTDAGYSISVWQTKEAMTDYVASKQHENTASSLKSYFVNQYTATHCAIKHFERGIPVGEPSDPDIYHTN